MKMKNRIFKRMTIIPLTLAIAASSLMLSSCGKQDTSSSTGASVQNEKSYTVGIAKFGPHASLDNCQEGFIQGLKAAGIEEGKNLTILTKDANFDGATANLVAKDLVNSKVDLICAIATPMAVAAMNAAYESDIPVVYSAVSDPKAAELTSGNVTGTSDKLPVEAQLKLIRALMPDAKKIGILYTTSEANSVSTIATYKELASKYGFEIVDKGITNASEVPLAMDSIVSKVDCISNLTDNTVVGALASVLDKAEAAGIPVFGSEIEQVKKGCIAAEGIDYIELGKQTGAMAAKILKGEATASSLPYEEISESFLYVNKSVLEKFKFKLPDDYSKRAEFVTADE